MPAISYISTVFKRTLKQLHWLPIELCQRFKLATLTSKALHTGRLAYLSDLLQHHELTRSLRSSSSRQLSVPRHNLTLKSRDFRFPLPEFEIHYLSASINFGHFLLSDFIYTSLFTIMVANEKKTEKQTEQKLN